MNGNTYYGRALMDMVAGEVPAFGNVFVVANSNDSSNPSYQNLSDVFQGINGVTGFYTDLATAYAATVSGNNDVIVMDAGTSHKLTAMLTVSNNKVHFIGFDGGGRMNNARTIISSSGAGASSDVSLVKVTGTGCSFKNIKFSNGFTVAQNLSAMLDYGQNTLFENCTFHNLGANHLTNVNAADLILAGSDSIYKNCMVGQDTLLRTVAASQSMLVSKGTSAHAATRVIFDHCWFSNYSNKTDSVFVKVGADGDIDRYIHFNNCSFLNFNTASDGALMAVAVQSAAGLVSGFMLFSFPSVVNASNLATAGVGNAGVFVVSPVLAAAASDCVAVQAS